MPVYLTHWRDGDVSMTLAKDREEAHAIFQEMACLDPEDILELKAPHLHITFTLQDETTAISP